MKIVRAISPLFVLILAGVAVPDAAAQPALSISDASANEPGAGTSPLRFAVTLSAPSGSTVTVDWSTSDGTATAPDDYIAGSGTLTFDPGAVTQTITVLVNADALTEAAETLQVTLASPVNATLADGTGVGTIGDSAVYLVKDIRPDAWDGLEGNEEMADVAGTLFFVGDSVGYGEPQLWKSDGTEAGTVMVSSAPALSIRKLTAVGGTLYFTANESTEIWKSDGTTAGTVLVKSFPSQLLWPVKDLTPAGNTLFFMVHDGTEDNVHMRLWKSDGTESGTVAVGPDPASGLLNAVGPTLFFTAWVSGSRELWRTDGTPLGTFRVTDSPMFSAGVLMDGILYWRGYQAATGDELWRSDGTAAGTWMVKDVAPGSASPHISSLTSVDGTLFFSCDDGTHGQELWRSDGTEAGTVLVKDIWPGPDSSGPGDLVAVGSTLYFFAATPTTGAELWKSDGTEAGTVLVEDIQPGTASARCIYYGGPQPRDVHGRLYLCSDDGTRGEELWTSDGTAEGTYLVQDLSPRFDVVGPGPFTVSGSRLFFGASRTDTGRELFALPLGLGVSVDDITVTEPDGTAIGAAFTVALSEPASSTVTVQYATANGTATAVSDYTPTSGTLSFAPGERVKTVSVDVLGDTAQEPTETFSLVLSNPTNASLRDGRGIGAIVDQDGPTVLSVGDSIVTEANATVTMTFTASLDKPSGSVVTVAYATADGTAVAGLDYTATSGTLTFAPGETTGTVTIDILGDAGDELTETFTLNLSNPVNALLGDGQASGTILDDDPPPALTISDASLNEPGAGTAPARFEVQLSAPSASTVTVAWATVDGTATAPADYVAGSGTLTFAPGTVLQTIEVAVNADASVESSEDFTVTLSSPANATVTDGTGIGTIGDPPAYVVKVLRPGGFSYPHNLTDVAGTLFFFANDGTGDKLWKSDGTEAGTVMVSTDTLAGRQMVDQNGIAYFITGETGSGVGELWRSDGTAAGTSLLHTFATDDYQEPDGLITMGGTIYFTAARQLWRSDGTAEGTVAYGPVFTSLWTDLARIGSSFVFTADQNSAVSELWRSDGTAAGTAQVYDDPGLGFQADGWWLATTGAAYFGGILNTYPPDTLNRLWRTDGSQAGTYHVAEVRWTGLGAAVDGTVLFSGVTVGTSDAELWKTDGTAAGTVRVKDIRPGTEGSAVVDLMAVGGTLYFCADDGTHGLELWKSDGTAEGTTLVKDANPGAENGCWSQMTNPVNANGTLYYSASDGDGNHGAELWTSDGTASGTYMVQDLSPTDDSYPENLTVSGSHLFFTTWFPQLDQDLWALPLPLGLVVDDVNVTEGDSGITAASFTVRLSAPSAQTVTVSYATANGTAVEGSDYTATSGALTFLPGERVKTIWVDVLGDATPELSEAFSLVLSNPTNARLRDGRGIGTISDNDAVTVSVADVTVTEANATVQMTFALSLSAPSGNAVTVAYTTANGTATAGVDYTATSGTVTFEPGIDWAVVTVNILGDTRDEPAETFTLNLSSPVNAVIGDGQGIGTIEDDDATPTLNVGNVTTTEGNSGSVNATFTVTLSAASGQEVTAEYATVDGTAVAGLDYTAVSGTLTFPAGTTSRTFAVPILGETLDEGTETYTVVLSNVVNAVAGTTGTGTITDNDTTTIAIANATAVAEGDTGSVDASFNVTLSVPNAEPVTVSYATADVTAVAGSDYTAASGTLTIPSGTTTLPVVVSVLGDVLDEANETFVVNLSDSSGPVISDAQGSVTINDDDASPALSIDDVTVLEGNEGTVDAVFTVTLSAASGRTVTVNRATQNSTAMAPGDYTALSTAALTFPAGTTTQQVTVQVNGDLLDEPNEAFYVNLSSASNATIADTRGVGTITDDDIPAVSIGNVTVTEGNSGTRAASFAVTLSSAGTGEITVSYATADGTAVAPDDYTAATGTVTFAAGTTTQTVTILVAGETLDESSETFTVTLSSPVGATLGTATGTGTITDDDTTTIGISNVTVTEGDDAAVDATFNITLAAPNPAEVSVSWATADATAVAGVDYTAGSGRVTFPAGTTTLPVTVSILGDVLDEVNETFVVNLSDSSGPTISDSQGVVTINDNDASPTLSIDDVTVLEGNEGTVNAVFTVTLSTVSGRSVTVNRATANVTAVAPDDYVALGSAALSFPAGTTTQTVTVQVNGDTIAESDETFRVNLSSASGATIADAQGVGTITDDDLTPSVSIGNVTVTEGDSSTKAASFAVTLSSPGTGEITVSYATADGTAVSPDDYAAATGTVTFPAGTTSQTVTVQVVGDLLDESNETFTVTLSSPVGATLGAATGTGTITDNDTLSIRIGNVTVTEGNDGPVEATFDVTLTAWNLEEVSVSWATADVTAVAGVDYTSGSGTLTFPVGTMSLPVTVSVLGDVLDEANETFAVNLSDSSGPTIADAQGVGTITDDDALPTLSIDDVTVLEGNEGAVGAVFTVSLSAVSGRTVTVNRATLDGTAVAPADYVALSTAALSFPAGTTTQQVTVQVNGDVVGEEAETFSVNLSGATNATIADAQGLGTITDDDAPTPSKLRIDDVSVIEGPDGTRTITFTVTREE